LICGERRARDEERQETRGGEETEDPKMQTKAKETGGGPKAGRAEIGEGGRRGEGEGE